MSPKSIPDIASGPRRPSATDRGTWSSVLVAAAWLPAVGLAGCGGGDGDGAAAADDVTEERTVGGEASAGADPASDGAHEEETEDAGADAPVADEDEDEDDDVDETEAEAAAAAEEEPDPQVVWRRKVRRGRRVYERVCGVCHPGGEEDLGPRIIGKRLSTRAMRRQIRQGIGRMRPIPPSKLPDRYMDELFAYLSTIRAVRGVSRP